VLAFLSVKGGFGLAAGVLVLISVFAENVFGAGATGIGLLMGARGLGALIGPFLGRWIAGSDDRRLFAAIGLALTIFGAAYVAFGLTPTLGMGALALAWALAWWLATRAIRHVPLVMGTEQATGEQAAGAPLGDHGS
jgi:predicted MFS family arabinose efflux permease